MTAERAIMNKIVASAERFRPEPAANALRYVTADTLQTQEPPDELVEGVLTTDGLSCFYGQSNVGKTFVLVDLCAAVSRGSDWLNRRTEQGVAVYLAAEAPGSVNVRLHAWQRHHGQSLPDLAVVGTPLDFYSGHGDPQRVVDVVKRIEDERSKPVRLIVGDTLARLSAGANENSSDMSSVIQAVDYVRSATAAHFVLIHHSGKNDAHGSRGWSGIKAALDTEIEIMDSVGGRYLEITKTRDLPGKGTRIGFALQAVELGMTKWGRPFTSCVVVPSEAPPPAKVARRTSEIAGAIVEFLANRPAAVRKGEVVGHFEGRYDKSAVYREIKRLREDGALHEIAGLVAVTSQVRKGAK